jgi:hypothetical protein
MKSQSRSGTLSCLVGVEFAVPRVGVFPMKYPFKALDLLRVQF